MDYDNQLRWPVEGIYVTPDTWEEVVKKLGEEESIIDNE